MKGSIFLIIFCAALNEHKAKHLFLRMAKSWDDAQAYCRQHYTDLSFILSQEEQDRLKEVMNGYERTWIGLHRDPENTSAWMWSGRGYMTYSNWNTSKPGDTEDGVELLSTGKWSDLAKSNLRNFYCISITAVEVKKSWEEALKHCREHHTDLTSLNSVIENENALQGIQHDHITDLVWIGLRYLGDHWLWVDGNPVMYKAWTQGGDQEQCLLRKRCGALTKEGHWENWNCEEKLNFICK